MRVLRPRPHLLLGVLLIFAWASPASAHLPPPLTITMELDEEALRVRFSLSAEIFRDWVTSLLPDRPGEILSGPLLERSEAFLAKATTVEADGIAVRPVVTKVERRVMPVHDGMQHFVHVSAEYGMKGKVGALAFAWKQYDNGVGVGVSPIDAELSAYGKADYPVFTEEEPGYVWHAPLAPRGDRPAAPPPTVEPETVTVPVVSAALGLLALVLVGVLLVHRARWRPIAATLGLALLAAFLLRGVAPIDVRPPWVPGFQMPTAADAARIFEGLHRNIYRAFDYDTEDEVYETLAQSVEGALLDDVYTEVYRSLILEDQGGAVCRIQKTEILENEIELPEDEEARAFYAVCRWRVRGKVTHWEHSHIRLNEYRARYRVHHHAGAWRIAAVDILEQKRVQR